MTSRLSDVFRGTDVEGSPTTTLHASISNFRKKVENSPPPDEEVREESPGTSSPSELDDIIKPFRCHFCGKGFSRIFLLDASFHSISIRK
jgi:hypothetical protein